MTKIAFLAAYREALRATYAWAANDPAKLDKFMQSVTATINGRAKSWNHDGVAVTAAWKAIGGKGKPSYTDLRSLPQGTV